MGFAAKLAGQTLLGFCMVTCTFVSFPYKLSTVMLLHTQRRLFTIFPFKLFSYSLTRLCLCAYDAFRHLIFRPV